MILLRGSYGLMGSRKAQRNPTSWIRWTDKMNKIKKVWLSDEQIKLNRKLTEDIQTLKAEIKNLNTKNKNLENSYSSRFNELFKEFKKDNEAFFMREYDYLLKDFMKKLKSKLNKLMNEEWKDIYETVIDNRKSTNIILNETNTLKSKLLTLIGMLDRSGVISYDELTKLQKECDRKYAESEKGKANTDEISTSDGQIR
jgi:hypothetical protein